MIVYVETNFILEIAFGQEESSFAEGIVRLAKNGNINLVIPVFSLIEPYWTLKSRAKDRKKISNDLSSEQRQIKRCSKNGKENFLLETTVESLLEFNNKESNNFEEILDVLLKNCEFIENNKTIFEKSLEYREKYNLEPQDSLIYSAFIKDMKERDDDLKCFLNKNTKDFYVQEIKEELEEYNCRIIPSFKGGLGYIESELLN